MSCFFGVDAAGARAGLFYLYVFAWGACVKGAAPDTMRQLVSLSAVACFSGVLVCEIFVFSGSVVAGAAREPASPSQPELARRSPRTFSDAGRGLPVAVSDQQATPGDVSPSVGRKQTREQPLTESRGGTHFRSQAGEKPKGPGMAAPPSEGAFASSRTSPFPGGTTDSTAVIQTDESLLRQEIEERTHSPLRDFPGMSPGQLLSGEGNQDYAGPDEEKEVTGLEDRGDERGSTVQRGPAGAVRPSVRLSETERGCASGGPLSVAYTPAGVLPADLEQLNLYVVRDQGYFKLIRNSDAVPVCPAGKACDTFTSREYSPESCFS